MSSNRKQEIERTVGPIIRKYDWYVEEVKEGYRLIVTDGVEDASVLITEDEDIESEAKRLINQVDKHSFVDLD